jgi:hypothetical protein
LHQWLAIEYVTLLVLMRHHALMGHCRLTLYRRPFFTISERAWVRSGRHCGTTADRDGLPLALNKALLLTYTARP